MARFLNHKVATCIHLIKVTFIILIVCTYYQCSDDFSEPTPEILSDENDILDINLSFDTLMFSTQIGLNSLHLGANLPSNINHLTLSSIQISPNATCNIQIGDEVEIINNQIEIKVTAENKLVKTYIGDITYDQDDFYVKHFDAQFYSKTYSKPVFIHYMPWFQTPEISGYWGNHWTMNTKNPQIINDRGIREIASHYYPLIGTYDTHDPDYIEYALLCIKLSGIDGILIDYYGMWNYYDYYSLFEASNLIIDRCKAMGLQFGIVYEDRVIDLASDITGMTKIEIAQKDLVYMRDHYFNSDLYFHINDEPVFMCFGPTVLLSHTDWEEIFTVVDNKVCFLPLGFLAETFQLQTSVSGTFSWVDQNLNNIYFDYAQRFELVGGSAFFEFREFYEKGGWEPSGQKDISPRGGELLRETFQRAIDANADFMQLITWNDWGEGTSMEPSLEYGFQALTKVQELIGMDIDSISLQLTIDLYKQRKIHQDKNFENLKLDQVFHYLNGLEIEKAYTLMNEIKDSQE